MKFSEKLQTLRKDKHLSQEQLAFMLDVSRQSVSKWESGQTYPEMDKLLELCKIFNCTLDDLTNDGVKEIKRKEKDKNSISNLVYSFLDLINKSYQMLSKMKFKNIVGCFLEMLFIFIILLILHNVINYIYYLGTNIFIHFGVTISSIISAIWKALLEIIYIIFGVIVFTYIYKIRYLDKYTKIEILNEKEAIKKQENIEEQPKLIIKKETTNGFFDVLSNIVIFFIKVFVFFIAIPFVFSLVFLGMCFIIGFILLFSGVFYIGINFMIVASVLLNLVFLYLVYYFIFNKRIKVKETLIVILSSLLLFGMGMGVFTIEVAKTSYVNEVSDIAKITQKEQIINMNSNLFVNPGYYKVTYIENNNLKNKIQAVASYYKDYKDVEINSYDNTINFNDIYYSKEVMKDFYKIILKDLSKKYIHNYSMLFDTEVTIYASKENIEILKTNQNNYLNTINEEENNDYYNQINELEEKIFEKEDTINNLQEENDNLKAKIESYTSELSNLLDE